MRLPIDADIFYAAQGVFARDCSKTRAMEQFLIDRSRVAGNIKDVADGVRLRASLLDMTPVHVVTQFLDEAGYGGVLDPHSAAIALCIAWGLPTDVEADQG